MPGVLIERVNWGRDLRDLGEFADPEDMAHWETVRRLVREGAALVLVARSEGETVGWILGHLTFRGDYGWMDEEAMRDFLKDRNGYVENLVVRDDLRGRGIGGKLLSRAEREFRRDGKRVLWLHVRADNQQARRFYEAAGWLLVQELRPAWNGGVLTCLYRYPLPGVGDGVER